MKSAVGNLIPVIAWRALTTVAHRRVLKNRNIRHYLPTIAFSIDEEEPDKKLFEVALAAIALAKRTRIQVNSNLRDAKFMNQFPGEHYRFLHALVEVWKPKSVVEIGTSTGMSASCILQALEKNGEGVLYSFDLVPFRNFQSHIPESATRGEKFTQIIGNLENREFFQVNKAILDDAELIFLDGPKNGRFEYEFLPLLTTLKGKRRLLLIDDIRFLNMIDLWRSIKNPKIDLTSFAHFSGTGLVLIEENLELNK